MVQCVRGGSSERRARGLRARGRQRRDRRARGARQVDLGGPLRGRTGAGRERGLHGRVRVDRAGRLVGPRSVVRRRRRNGRPCGRRRGEQSGGEGCARLLVVGLGARARTGPPGCHPRGEHRGLRRGDRPRPARHGNDDGRAHPCRPRRVRRSRRRQSPRTSSVGPSARSSRPTTRGLARWCG